MLVGDTMKGLVRYGAPAKWARNMTPNMAYNPTHAFYTQPSGLEPKYAYILM